MQSSILFACNITSYCCQMYFSVVNKKYVLQGLEWMSVYLNVNKLLSYSSNEILMSVLYCKIY